MLSSDRRNWFFFWLLYSFSDHIIIIIDYDASDEEKGSQQGKGQGTTRTFVVFSVVACAIYSTFSFAVTIPRDLPTEILSWACTTYHSAGRSRVRAKSYRAYCLNFFFLKDFTCFFRLPGYIPWIWSELSSQLELPPQPERSPQWIQLLHAQCRPTQSNLCQDLGHLDRDRLHLTMSWYVHKTEDQISIMLFSTKGSVYVYMDEASVTESYLRNELYLSTGAGFVLQQWKTFGLRTRISEMDVPAYLLLQLMIRGREARPILLSTFRTDKSLCRDFLNG